MRKVSMVIAALRLIAHKPTYLVLALVLTIFLFVLYFILNNFSTFASIVAVSIDPTLLWKVFVNQVNMIWEVSGPLNILAVVAVSFLAGINLSLIILRIRVTKVLVGRPSVLGFLGVSGGAFGAACSACNTSLIALLGVSGGLAVFPFGGLELSLLALILLAISLYYVSKSMIEIGVIKQ